ncbi:hypothetical protein M406DRAFT_108428 [Cryphonectria parasitica EP155]|uniref:Uncharacterized protein n=1 Tax=Cryphonectria parasitica (strain ATCC 38755 / EP155) TaxID=660469 RepID=A0A9P5CKP2_CRYP1|nr:uncharacterized protein M406DRAFT_108428 [Cryphonectria parasitica EP155]KAF3761181.1 hypothetical protein M406DRAFT_108428 [Cryphonectria parasitica EP155]
MASHVTYTPVDQARASKEMGGRPPPDNSSHTTNHRGCRAAWAKDGWFVEIASTLLGILCVVALLIVLRHYDGRPTPYYGSALGTSLTLNTIIATLSTVAKAALLYPVTECVSQLKWVWFSKESHQLNDMSMFDKASRGIRGGFQLLWATRLRTFAILGPFLMLFGLAMDPLSQQLVYYHSVAVKTSASATIPIATSWVAETGDGGMIIDGAGFADAAYNAIPTGLKGAIQTGLYSANVLVEDIAPSCPSLNCSFPSYASLAVCSSFADITSHLVSEIDPEDDEFLLWYLSGSSSNISIETMTYFNTGSASSNNTNSTANGYLRPLDFNNSIAFTEVPLPLADIFVLYETGTNASGSTTFGAVEFIMEWCVQEYTTEVVNGSVNTSRQKATRNFTNPLYPTLQVGSTTYTIDPSTHVSTSVFLDRILQGYVYRDWDAEQYWHATSDAIQALYEPYNVFQDISLGEIHYSLNSSIRGTNQTGLEFIINNMGTSMTNYIRENNAEVANGTSHSQEVLVKVRWKWFAAHASFIVLCLLLLSSTLIATRLSVLKSLAWKSSPSAVLHALSSNLQHASTGILTESESTPLDQAQLVYLCNVEGEGWRLQAHDGK